jgi:hypothetical protein
MAQVQVTILTGCARDDKVQAVNPKTAIDVQTTLQETSDFILLCVCYVHQQYTKADPKLLVLILKINVVPKENHKLLVQADYKHHNPEGSNLRIHSHGNLKPHRVLVFSPEFTHLIVQVQSLRSVKKL